MEPLEDRRLLDSIAITTSLSTIAEDAGNKAAYGNVTLSAAAPGNVTVNLSSVNLTGTAPELKLVDANDNPITSVAIAAGDDTATFYIDTVHNTAYTQTQTVEITGTAPGYTSGSKDISVTDAESVLSVLFDKTSFTDSDGAGAATGTVKIPAAIKSDLTVALTSTNTDAATVESSQVTIYAGDTSATFKLDAVQHSSYVGTETATVRATADGWVTGVSPTISVTDTNLPGLKVALSPTTIAENGGKNAATGTVTLGTPAPGSGATVTLTSSNLAQAEFVDPVTGNPVSTLTLTIPSTSSSATFGIYAVDDGIVETSPSSVTITASASGYTVGTGSLTVTNTDVAKTIAVVLSPSTVSEDAGNNAATGTVTLSVAAPSGGLTISLTSNNSAQATIETSTVTIPAGQSSAQFVIDAHDDHVVETSPSSVIITASAPGSAYALGTATLTVTNIDVANTLTVNLNPTTFAENAGTNAATGTVTIPQPAPTGGLTITLTSSNTSQATVPLTVTIPEGATSSGSFVIGAVDDEIAETESSDVTIAATATGYTQGTAALTVTNTDVAKTISVTLNPTTIAENSSNTVTGTVTILQPAPTGGLKINLTSSNTAQATVDATTTILAGQMSAPFTIAPQDDHVAETSDSSVTITAAGPAGSGYTSGTATLTVLNTDPVNSLTVTINPTTFAENAGTNAATGTVTIPQPAPTGGLTITLTSSNTSQATVPLTVTIPEGATSSGSFVIGAVDDGIAETESSAVTITATATGYTQGTAALTVTNTDPAKTISVTLNPTTIAENSSNTVTGTVTILQPAPTGGLKINLTSSNTAQATVDATTTILAGQMSAPFTIAPQDDHVAETSDSSVTITAAGPAGSGYTSGTATLTVLNTDPVNSLTVTINPTTFAENAGTNAATGTVTIPQPAPTGGLTITLTSSNTSQATVPLTVKIPEGATSSGSFVIGAEDDGIAETESSAVTITATATGYTQGTAALTVTNTDAAKTISVTLNPTTIAENSSNTVTGTVTILQPAPTGGLKINLTSSNTGQATVDATTTILAGQMSAMFTITPKDDGVAETSDSNVTITAAGPAGSGYTSGTATLTVLNTDTVKTLTVNINPSTIAENALSKAASGTVTVPVAPATDLTISLSSSNTAQATLESSTVKIPAGQTSSAPFYIDAVDDGVVETDASNVTITATATGYTLGTAPLTVTNTDVAKTITLTLSASSISEAGTATGTVTLSQAAPAGGLTVYLSSSDTTSATVPSTVTIAGGTSSNTFTVSGVNDGIVESARSVTITASADGYTSGPATVSVTDIDSVAKTITVNLNPKTISESDGKAAATGVVALSVPAPSGGLTVSLTSSNTAQATIETSTVTIPAGQSSAQFVIDAVDDGLVETSPSSVTITATASGSGYTSNTATLTVNNIDVTKGLTVGLNPATISEGDGNKASTGTVTVNVAPTSNLVVTLTSSNTAQATVETSTVTILAGQTSAQFFIDAKDDGIVEPSTSPSTVTITASAAGYSVGGANLTVTNIDASPPLSIGDVTNWEDSGKNGFIFTVKLLAPSATTVQLLYTTVDGTAIAGKAPGSQTVVGGPANVGDYKATSGTLTFQPGQISGVFSQINVPVYEDTALAVNQTKIFYVVLSNANGATIARATGTIVGDPNGTGAASGIPPVVDPPATTNATTSAQDPVGLYSPTNSTFYLRYANQSGPPDVTFTYGVANAGWIPIAGDWDGNGTTTLGLYNPATSTFYLRNSTSLQSPSDLGYADVVFTFGQAGAGWIPIAGDWNGDGKDSIGLYNPTTSTFYLRDTTSLQGPSDLGYADVTFNFGQANLPAGSQWVPIAGDWNQDGKDTIGLYDPTTSKFYLRNTTSLQGPTDLGYADVVFAYGAPGAGWKPIAGDWNSDGKDSIGLYNPATSTFYLRNSISLQGATDLGYADMVFSFGTAGAGWLPIAGDWMGPANACLAAGGAVAASANVPTLTQADLQPIVSAAIARWASAGLDATAVAKLTQAQFVVSDLPGSYLGEAEGDVIYIDGNAAGHGWFVDPTPAADGEFTASSSAGQLQAVDPRAIDRMDLLTVVEHELGHELGLSDLASSAGDLMSRTLSAGVRRIATPSDAVFADNGSWL